MAAGVALAAGVVLYPPSANAPPSASSWSSAPQAPAYPAPGAAGPAPARPGDAATGNPVPLLPAAAGRSSDPRAIEIRLSTAYPGHAWLIETVDGQPWSGTDTSLALDSQGYPHIAYHGAGDTLRYASFDGTGWQTETVDAFDLTGIMPSLALDEKRAPCPVISAT